MIAVDPAMLAPPVAAPRAYLIVATYFGPGKSVLPLKVNKLRECQLISEYEPEGKIDYVSLPYREESPRRDIFVAKVNQKKVMLRSNPTMASEHPRSRLLNPKH